MKFVVLTVPSAKEDWADQATEKYLEKINHFIKIEIVSIANKKLSRESAVEKKTEESKQILDFIKNDDFVILMDEGGKTLSSEKFSDQIQKILLSGKKRCVWIIGGSFGVDENVKKRAQLQISFGPMVFNHLLAKTMLLEQIYRGFTIIKNIPYHNK